MKLGVELFNSVWQYQRLLELHNPLTTFPLYYLVKDVVRYDFILEDVVLWFQYCCRFQSIEIIQYIVAFVYTYKCLNRYALTDLILPEQKDVCIVVTSLLLWLQHCHPNRLLGKRTYECYCLTWKLSWTLQVHPEPTQIKLCWVPLHAFCLRGEEFFITSSRCVPVATSVLYLQDVYKRQVLVQEFSACKNL